VFRGRLIELLSCPEGQKRRSIDLLLTAIMEGTTFKRRIGTVLGFL
jgi:hypothetical protein